MIALSCVGIVKTYRNGDEGLAFRFSCLILSIFLIVSFFTGFLVIINASTVKEELDLAQPVILLVFQAVAAATLLIALINNKNKVNSKIFAGIGYSFLFVTLIMATGAGLKGLAAGALVFLFLACFIGAIITALHGIDLSNLTARLTYNVEKSFEEQILKLNELHEKNLLTDEEYEEKRKELISKL